MDRRFMAILAVIILIFVGVVALNNNSKSNTSNNSGGTKPSAHYLGKNSKGVTLVEYGDYECPICGLYYQPLKQLSTQFENDIHFQFRNLPLSSIHPNAFAAARAAEAAGYQGKFWEMHDKIYENQSDWSSATNAAPIFEGYAKDLGLNLTQYKADFSSQRVNNQINADLTEFGKTGQQQATPTFFLDGKYISNDQVSDQNGPSLQKFSALIQSEISKKSAQKQ